MKSLKKASYYDARTRFLVAKDMIEEIKKWLNGEGGVEQFGLLSPLDILDYVEKVATEGGWDLIRRFVKQEREKIDRKAKRSHLRVIK